MINLIIAALVLGAHFFLPLPPPLKEAAPGLCLIWLVACIIGDLLGMLWKWITEPRNHGEPWHPRPPVPLRPGRRFHMLDDKWDVLWNESLTRPRQFSTCVWKQSHHHADERNWSTACGQEFTFIEGGPTENEMVFCCYCGRTILQVKREEQHNDD